MTVPKKSTTEASPDYFSHVIFEVVYSLGISVNATKCSVHFTSGAPPLQPTPRSLSCLSGVIRYTVSAVYHREVVFQSGLCRGCVLTARLTLSVPFTWRSYLALTDESRWYRPTSHSKHVTQTCDLCCYRPTSHSQHVTHLCCYSSYLNDCISLSQFLFI